MHKWNLIYTEFPLFLSIGRGRGERERDPKEDRGQKYRIFGTEIQIFGQVSYLRNCFLPLLSKKRPHGLNIVNFLLGANHPREGQALGMSTGVIPVFSGLDIRPIQ